MIIDRVHSSVDSCSEKLNIPKILDDVRQVLLVFERS